MSSLSVVRDILVCFFLVAAGILSIVVGLGITTKAAEDGGAILLFSWADFIIGLGLLFLGAVCMPRRIS